jgi:hypothetical protein
MQIIIHYIYALYLTKNHSQKLPFQGSNNNSSVKTIIVWLNQNNNNSLGKTHGDGGASRGRGAASRTKVVERRRTAVAWTAGAARWPARWAARGGRRGGRRAGAAGRAVAGVVRASGRMAGAGAPAITATAAAFLLSRRGNRERRERARTEKRTRVGLIKVELFAEFPRSGTRQRFF